MFTRRSGSFARVHLEGSLPAPGDPAWIKGFSKHRFRTIEDAASEEESIGWVSADDPTGETFSEEHCLLDQVVVVRVRADRKRVPGKWLAIRLQKEMRGLGKAGARKKRDLKEKLKAELLPRVLPSIALVDVLIRPRIKEAFVFSTAVAAHDAFSKLMLETFSARSIDAGPRQVALRAGISREQKARLEEAAPTDFTASRRRAKARADEATQAEALQAEATQAEKKEGGA